MAGFSAYAWANERVNDYNRLLQQFSCQPNELSEKIGQFQKKTKDLEKKLRAFEQKGQAGLAEDLLKKAKEKNGINIIIGQVQNLLPNDLRSLAAQVNKRSNPSVVLLASEKDDKCSMVCICSPKAVEAGHLAGSYLSELASQLDGKGGGKPDFAMGGASANKGLNKALESHSINS